MGSGGRLTSESTEIVLDGVAFAGRCVAAPRARTLSRAACFHIPRRRAMTSRGHWCGELAGHKRAARSGEGRHLQRRNLMASKARDYRGAGDAAASCSGLAVAVGYRQGDSCRTLSVHDWLRSSRVKTGRSQEMKRIARRALY